MGCLAGPVTVCAVAFTPHFYARTHRKLAWLRDSKMLQAHQRENFAAELSKKQNLTYTIVSVSPKVIDRINIYQAARQAMKRAIKKLTDQNKRAIVLVDGKTKIHSVSHDQMPIVKGDRKVFAIACASILAKVHRDALMVRYAKHYPGYGLEQHKGYGTKLHRQKIKELGLTPLHRRSFRWDN